MPLFRITALIWPLAPLRMADGDGPPLVGYYQSYVLAADDEIRARELVETANPGARVDWDNSTLAVTTRKELAGHIAGSVLSNQREGICWRSGRAFFPAADDKTALD